MASRARSGHITASTSSKRTGSSLKRIYNRPAVLLGGRVLPVRRHTRTRLSLAFYCKALFSLVLFAAMERMSGETVRVAEDGDFTTIQAALDSVAAGDSIVISTGHYFENVETKVDGTLNAPITIRGEPETNREDVVLRGAAEDLRLFRIRHDYYIIEDFTIDGKLIDDDEEDHDFEDIYRDILLYVQPDRAPTEREGGYFSALDGLIVRNMLIQNAGGECFRLRYFVTNAKISDNTILNCGLYDFVYDDGGKNGEGVYIGTSSSQWDDGNNFSDEPDECRGIIVSNNTITTNGNEGVEIKEGSADNIVEYNEIYMQLDEDSGGIDSRGDGTIIRYNHIEDAEGAGVRVGGWMIEGIQYGLNNEVYGNTIVDCRSYGVKIMAWPQGQICENEIELPPGVDESNYKFSGGSFHDEVPDPTVDCDLSGALPTSATTLSPFSAPLTTPSPITETPTSHPSTSIPSTLVLSTSAPMTLLFGTGNPFTATPSTSPLGTSSPSNDITPVTASPSTGTPGAPYSLATHSSTTPTLSTPAPLASSPPSTTGTYLGCYYDGEETRTMKFGYKDTTGLTNQACLDFCRGKGELFAGTLKARVCRCTSTSWKIDRHGESTDCTLPCPGNTDEVCGGKWAVSTYEV